MLKIAGSWFRRNSLFLLRKSASSFQCYCPLSGSQPTGASQQHAYFCSSGAVLLKDAGLVIPRGQARSNIFGSWQGRDLAELGPLQDLLTKCLSALEFLWGTRAFLSCLARPFKRTEFFMRNEVVAMCCGAVLIALKGAPSSSWKNIWNFMELRLSFTIGSSEVFLAFFETCMTCVDGQSDGLNTDKI